MSRQDSTEAVYFDFQDGFIRYSYTKNSTTDLSVRLLHNHLWTKQFCESRSIDELADLSCDAADSVNAFLGNVSPAGGLLIGQNNTSSETMLNLSGIRMFMEHDAQNIKTISRCRLLVETVPAATPVRITNHDSIIVKIVLHDVRASDPNGTIWTEGKAGVQIVNAEMDIRPYSRYEISEIAAEHNGVHQNSCRLFTLDGRSIMTENTNPAVSARKANVAVWAHTNLGNTIKLTIK